VFILKWQDDLNVVGNLEKLCKEAEKIKMVHKAAYMVTIFYSSALFGYPKNFKRLDEIFNPVLENLNEKLKAEKSPLKQKEIEANIYSVEQVKDDYYRRLILWYELGDKSVNVRIFERIDNIYGLKASQLKLLEDTYKRFNKEKGNIHLSFIKWQLSLASPTDVRKPRIYEAANKCPEARQFLEYLNGLEVEKYATKYSSQYKSEDTEKSKDTFQEHVIDILEKGRAAIKANSKETEEHTTSKQMDNISR